MKKLLLIPLLLFLLQEESFGVTVEKIEVEGLRWTKKEFVLRELLIKPGKDFSREKLEQSIRNLLNTHLFYRIEPRIQKRKNGVIVVLRVKERFPIVPLPKFRVRSSGSYRAGFEVRDYNLMGMGHKIYAGYVKWFKSKDESFNYYTYFNLYRVVNGNFNVYGGVNYSSEKEDYVVNSVKNGEYRVKRKEFLLGTHIYLDKKKVNQLDVGLKPAFVEYSQILNDKHLYYVKLSYTKDLSTDMVYYQKGSLLNISINQTIPGVSSLSTGSITASYTNSIDYGNYRTGIYSLGFGTKLGYSGGGYQLTAPIPGYRDERVTGKRYLFASFSIRNPIIDRSLYFKPTLVVGDAFRWRPNDLLVASGFEVTAFWAKLVDGIIRFKLFRGIGREADTQSSLKLTFRW